MVHVIGVVDFICTDVAFSRHALINAKPAKRRQHQRCAVEQEQLAGFFLINGGGGSSWARVNTQQKAKTRTPP